LEGYSVHSIKREDAIPWIMRKHYAHRKPGSIIHAFGLFCVNRIIGICTFGMSPNMHLNKVGEYNVLELNRLIVEERSPKNVTSYFIGKIFKVINKPVVLVSYADTGQNHYGYIYQATNWIYTGTSSGQDLYEMSDGKILHKRALDQQFNNNTRNKNDIVNRIKSQIKHRYFYFLGTKKQVKEMKAALRYSILPYPKGESKRYDTSATFPKQVQMF
jgi:hypothetical protein